MTIDARSIVMTGAPVEYAQDKNRKRYLAGAANTTGTSAEHTANLTEGGARGVN
jgi:hypothetical protein